MSTVTEKVSNAGKLVRAAIGSALSGVHAGEAKITSRQADHSSDQLLIITSSAFTNGAAIPRKYTPQAENVSPPLSWKGVPSGTRELILLVEDPDAPMLKPFVHWIMHRIPAGVTSLPEGVPATQELSQTGGAVQGMNDFKTRGYGGPQPPLGHGVHHYHFQLFAVDTQLSFGPDATIAEISAALTGHVLADGEIVGTYERTVESD